MSSKAKILLLDPPNPPQHGAILDGYCSQPTKAHYRWHPVDLILQTGYLQNDFEIDMFDAAARGASEREVLDRIKLNGYDAILSLVGWVSLKENISLFEKIKELAPDIFLAVSGDIAHYEPEWFLQRAPEVDAVLGEMTSSGLVQLLIEGNQDAHSMITRGKDGEIHRGSFRRNETFGYSIPRHDLFPNQLYRLPFPGTWPFASVVTQVGCPRRCSFCPIAGYDYRRREIDNLLEETDYLSGQGIRHLYLRDPSLSIVPDHARKIAEAFIRKGYDFTFNAFTNLEGLDYKLASLLNKAGCKILQFGVETSSSATLEAVHKGGDPGETAKILADVKQAGITTLGTFVFGLENETEQDIRNTVDYMIKLPLDFVSINLLEVRPGSELWEKEVKRSGSIDALYDQQLQFGMRAARGSKLAMLENMVKTANRRFYLRPSFIIRNALNVRAASDLTQLIYNALLVLRKK
jgi:radical SAM superfamily enzyme YgiQ (UPF0313 family)